MEDRNGSATFCFDVWFGPVKMSECPPLLMSESDVDGSETDTGDALSSGESVSKEGTVNSNEKKNLVAENTENISAGSGQLSFVLIWWLGGTILLASTAW